MLGDTLSAGITMLRSDVCCSLATALLRHGHRRFLTAPAATLRLSRSEHVRGRQRGTPEAAGPMPTRDTRALVAPCHSVQRGLDCARRSPDPRKQTLRVLKRGGAARRDRGGCSRDPRPCVSVHAGSRRQSPLFPAATSKQRRDGATKPQWPTAGHARDPVLRSL